MKPCAKAVERSFPRVVSAEASRKIYAYLTRADPEPLGVTALDVDALVAELRAIKPFADFYAKFSALDAKGKLLVAKRFVRARLRALKKREAEFYRFAVSKPGLTGLDFMISYYYAYFEDFLEILLGDLGESNAAEELFAVALFQSPLFAYCEGTLELEDLIRFLSKLSVVLGERAPLRRRTGGEDAKLAKIISDALSLSRP